MRSTRPQAQRRVAAISVWFVLTAALATIAVGAILKQPCATGSWADGRQYRALCYTDVVPLYGTEQLQGGRLPYLDACAPSSGQCDEYPLLTMYFMRVAAWLGDGYGGFFFANAALLTLCALFTGWSLHRLAGPRALYFALAPTLGIYAFVNWDLLAVALATAGTLAYLRGKEEAGGALLGLGAAAKLYPALLVIPFALGRMREGRADRAAALFVWAIVAYGAVNLPFVLLAPEEWFTFFRFNSSRGADWDSLWFVACTRVGGEGGCGWSTGLVNVLSPVLFAGLATLTWWARSRREPAFPAWTFGFPLLVLFLLTSKVYSPQFSLWLLPWFALALPDPFLFAAFQVADVAVFVTRFTWFGRLAAEAGDPAFAGFGGVPLGAFQAALVVRAVVLVACVVAWTRRADTAPGPDGLLPATVLSAGAQAAGGRASR